MKKQQNKQKLDEMEAAMLAASEEMKTRQQEMDSERSKKMKLVSLSLSFSLPSPTFHEHLMHYMRCLLLTVTAFCVDAVDTLSLLCLGSSLSSLLAGGILELQGELPRELDCRQYSVLISDTSHVTSFYVIHK